MADKSGSASVKFATGIGASGVTDTFNRADNSSTLGVSDSGRVWSDASYGISGNQGLSTLDPYSRNNPTQAIFPGPMPFPFHGSIELTGADIPSQFLYTSATGWGGGWNKLTFTGSGFPSFGSVDGSQAVLHSSTASTSVWPARHWENYDFYMEFDASIDRASTTPSYTFSDWVSFTMGIGNVFYRVLGSNRNTPYEDRPSFLISAGGVGYSNQTYLGAGAFSTGTHSVGLSFGGVGDTVSGTFDSTTLTTTMEGPTATIGPPIVTIGWFDAFAIPGDPPPLWTMKVSTILLNGNPLTDYSWMWEFYVNTATQYLHYSFGYASTGGYTDIYVTTPAIWVQIEDTDTHAKVIDKLALSADLTFPQTPNVYIEADHATLVIGGYSVTAYNAASGLEPLTNLNTDLIQSVYSGKGTNLTFDNLIIDGIAGGGTLLEAVRGSGFRG